MKTYKHCVDDPIMKGCIMR